MNRQTQAADQTRTNLREAFWELYAEKPIEKITVREITDRAGYNRATFYLYYRDVYDVLEQVKDTVMGGIESLVNDRLMRGESLDFTEHMGTILQLSRQYSSYIAVLLGDNGDPAFANRFKEAVKPLVRRFVLPVEGITGSEGRIVEEFYLSGLVAAIRAWLADDDPLPIDQLVNLIMSMVLVRQRPEATD